MAQTKVPTVSCGATSSKRPQILCCFFSTKPARLRSWTRQPGRLLAYPDRKRTVNFTDVQTEKTDIFDLDKSINSALQWEKVRDFLNERGGVMSVTKAKADKLVAECYFTCIDVRPEKGFNEGTRVLNSINVPLFKGTDQSGDLQHMPRKVFFTLLPGVEGTFYNEKFVDEVLNAQRRLHNTVMLQRWTHSQEQVLSKGNCFKILHCCSNSDQGWVHKCSPCEWWNGFQCKGHPARQECSFGVPLRY